MLINAGFRTVTRSFQEDLVAESSRTLYLLWGGVLSVLIIGCVNVANLVSVRAGARARELATRHALGASLQRLSRQIFTETILMALLGGILGIVLGRWALTAGTALGFDQLPRGTEIVLDAQAIAFTLLLIVAVGVLVGLFPVIALRRASLSQIVREEGRGGTPSRRTRLVRRGLVTSQVAFALVLLVGAGLLLASFQRVLAVDPGFEAARLLTGSVSLPVARYADTPAVHSATERLLERVRTIPGVVDAGWTSTLPISGDHSDSVIFAEGYQTAPGESLISPSQVRVSPGYFEAMRTELKEGRFFDTRDTAAAPPAIIVDEQLARKFWPGQSPIGRLMYFPQDASAGLKPPPREEWMTVVGVIENVRLDGLVDGPGFRTVGAYYLPLAQAHGADADARRAYDAGPDVGHQRDSPGSPWRGRRTAVLRRAHDGGARVLVARRSANADAARHRVCGGRAAARRDRHLRDAGVSSQPAAARDCASAWRSVPSTPASSGWCSARGRRLSGWARGSDWPARISCAGRCSRSSMRSGRWIRASSALSRACCSSSRSLPACSRRAGRRGPIRSRR